MSTIVEGNPELVACPRCGQPVLAMTTKRAEEIEKEGCGCQKKKQ